MSFRLVPSFPRNWYRDEEDCDEHNHERYAPLKSPDNVRYSQEGSQRQLQLVGFWRKASDDFAGRVRQAQLARNAAIDPAALCVQCQ